MATNVLSSEKPSHRNIQLESIFRNNGDLLRNMAPDHGLDQLCPDPSLSPLSVSADILNSERKGKKLYDATNDHLYSIPSSSPTLITISEAKSRSTSSSSSATTNFSCTRSRDEEGSSDSSTNDSQGGCLDSAAANAPIKRHTGTDSRWEAIQLISSRDPPLSLRHFKLVKRLGYGDIGSVYLVELKGTGAIYAMKMMDKASLVSRNKLLRAQTEREILSLLDHPFLPTLYSHFETEKFNCLVMEYCSGGNLHSLRQKQPNRHFCEKAARFYASEVLLSIEYLHMLGIVYRDLKPENVLVRENGHIMLSDFDLSLQCSVKPRLLLSSSPVHGARDADNVLQGCMQPKAFFPRILPKKNHKHKPELSFGHGALPELMAEPTSARSMSFVGTHEYLAPEIIRGEGHGSAVDWWTFGIFLYELLYGTTPFKGSGNRATLFNVVGQPLLFPEVANVSATARELIRGLLVKEPQKRIGYRRGATEIKQHPFFEGVNWALVRSATPPHVPEAVDVQQRVLKELCRAGKKAAENGGNGKRNDSAHQNFKYF